MYKTLHSDMHYLENKYHDTTKPFDAYNRMAYHGYEYDASTGLDDIEMKKGLAALCEKYRGLSHPVIKARLFEYVLDNARIDVNEHDWFVGFYNWGRPLDKFTCIPWKSQMYERMPEEKALIDLYQKTGIVAINPDFDHVIPNWNDLLALGFKGTLERIERYHAALKDSGITEEQESFFDGMEISYNAILRLIDRYYKLALTKSHGKALCQAECLKQIKSGSPRSLYEALQVMYIFFILCECVDHFQTRSLGNGIDDTLLPFFRNDISGGKYTLEDEKEMLAYFFMQFSAIGNYWGHPMYLGGTNADGSTKYNELSDLILDIYGELKIYNPKIQIKVNTNTPRKVLYKVFDLERKGISSFVFCGEPGHIKAVMGYGATFEEARNFELAGCYETRIKGDEACPTVGYINSAKCVELVFTNGIDRFTGERIGVQTGAVEDMETFEDFYFAFLTQWNHFINTSVHIGNTYDPYLAFINPSNVFSGTMERALEKGVDGYAFGMKFRNSHMLNCGFASTVDSIMAVKKLCYDNKVCTPGEMKKALENDWVGYEKLRSTALKLPQKYGNSEPETDTMAAAMADYYSNSLNNRPTGRGGVYKAIMHTAMMFVWQGEKTGALPDGRKAGTELSKNASPVAGMDKNGATALIRSALKLHPYNYHESFCVDVMLHPSAVEGEDGLTAMYSLLMTYVKNYGMSIQFNIFNADMLRDAQAHPESYRNLQVRVCGWNVLWNNLSKEEQDAYILRSENIKC